MLKDFELGCDMIGGRVVYCFKLVANVVRGGVWQFVYDTNPSTPNNISTITPYQPNASSLTPSPLKGVASVITLMTSTHTPPTSLEPSHPEITQSLSSKNSYSMASANPTHLAPRTPITCHHHLLSWPSPSQMDS